MEVVNIEEGRYEQQNNIQSGSSFDSDGTSSVSESSDSDHMSDVVDKSDDEQELREDLQKTIPQCYKSDSTYTSYTSSDIANDEEFQATALCQFMDILNDLDEVLDKSLLACLDDGSKTFDTDDEDLICKIKECIGNSNEQLDFPEVSSSVDDNTEVVVNVRTHSSTPPITEIDLIETDVERPQLTNLCRSKSLSDLSGNHHQALVSLLDSVTTNENLRSSMRRLEPIVLPEISTEEPLTLPVILFLEHNVNMRPTSAPIQLQVTTATLNSDSTPRLIVGRRALLMNRTLSLPSPGESDITTGEWTAPNTARSTARSTSAYSSSDESLNGDTAANQPTIAATEERNEETEQSPYEVWEYNESPRIVYLGCTLGIFNISRFALFSVHYGGNFIVQFFILTLLFGIPLHSFHFCLGHVLKAGPVDMWKISPIFQGLGVSFLISQAVIGMYSIVGLSWIFVYFRDSFIKIGDQYKWELLEDNFPVTDMVNGTIVASTFRQYFQGEVLQKNVSSSDTGYGTIKFQVAFNLAVIWMIVFVALSKGLRTYGKVVTVLLLCTLLGTCAVGIRMFLLLYFPRIKDCINTTVWSEFFTNSGSWAAATQETFLTYGLLGPCIMQIASQEHIRRRATIMLRKDCIYAVIATCTILGIMAFLAYACFRLLLNDGFYYIPTSFEAMQSSQILYSSDQTIPNNLFPGRYRRHYANFLGLTLSHSGNTNEQSGWCPLHFPTQLAPHTFAVLTSNKMIPLWPVIFYSILIMFGLVQQITIWHTVIAGIIAINPKALTVWKTTITFVCCVFGLAVGLLLSTDASINIIHYIDFVWVGSWWQAALQVLLAFGMFVIRGRPYSPDVMVAALFPPTTRFSTILGTMLSFSWIVVMPVLLCVTSGIDFRLGLQRQLYQWKKPLTTYWPVWMLQMGAFVQLSMLLIVPAVAFVQTWRYLSKGPPDIFECIQNLYRPRMGAPSETAPAPASTLPQAPAHPDPPPKYTPPPSYSTATGARLLNTLRRSFRTIRRITSSRNESQYNDASQIPITLSETVDRERNATRATPPPEYSSRAPSITITDETNRQQSSNSRSTLSLSRDYIRRSFIRKGDSTKSIRSSLRRSFKYGGALTTSHEQLVRDVEPISNTVAMSTVVDRSSSPQSPSFASAI